MTTTPIGTSRAEIRPKHAVCVKCGYEFAGAVAVVDGVMVCPECGYRQALLHDRPPREKWIGSPIVIWGGPALAVLWVADLLTRGPSGKSTVEWAVLVGVTSIAMALLVWRAVRYTRKIRRLGQR